MKKPIAIILLSSALLLPNNNTVEAAYSDTNSKGISVQYIEYIGGGRTQIHSDQLKLHMKGFHNFYTAWKNCFEVINPKPSIPTEEPDKKPGQEIEQKPEIEVVPESKPETKPTPEVEVVPEQKPEPTPEQPVTPVPEVVPTPTPVEPAPEKPSQPVEDTVNTSISSIERAVLDLTNVERQKAGLAALKVDPKLMDSARAKSKDMSTQNYFSHTSPTYGSPFDQMKAYGISYRSAAENIARGQRSAEEVVNGWMASPGHRENILSSNFTHIGIGYDASGHYWTQQFIGK